MKLYQAFVCIFFLQAFSGAANPLDSVRTEMQKGRRYIIHRMDKGQGLYAVARRYNTDVQKIREANPGKTDKLGKDDLIRIPLDSDSSPVFRADTREKVKAVPPKAEKARADTSVKKQNGMLEETHANAEAVEKSTAAGTHTVQPGETLSKIALKYKITSQLLMKWNGLKDTRLEVGEVLIVDASLVIKPYEKWNAPNSVSSRTAVPPHILAEVPLVEETGFATAAADPKSVLHRDAPVGTVMLLSNLDNGRQCYVTVTGHQAGQEKENILSINENIRKKLEINTDVARVSLRYIAP